MGIYKNKEMVKASYYYYKKGLTQSEIAEKMGMSRQRVNRVLKSALEENIVNITIVDMDKYNLELESKLEEKFHLKQSVVISAIDDKAIVPSLGIAGAEYLEDILSKDDIIGFTWGKTLSEVAKRIKPNTELNVSAVQLVGGLNIAFTSLSPDEITRTIAKKLGGESYMIFAPVIVDSKEIKDAIMSDYSLRTTFQNMDRCNIIVAGIGELNQDTKLYKDREFNKEFIQYLISKGSVGDIGFRWFDNDGQPIEHKYNNRTIGFNILEKKSDSLVVGIAGGESKYEAILGALKGRYIDVLITDNETAKRLIEN
ncbi:MAG: sugar-binding transcriptional regulator [Tissierellaceae bacterium]|nr:sugar-binding transcriptional regulator [Tissierellaceae bacterium]